MLPEFFTLRSCQSIIILIVHSSLSLSLSNTMLHSSLLCRHLDLGNNDIASVAGLAQSCPNLQKVNLGQNNITDAAPLVELVNLPSMQFLNVAGNDMKAMAMSTIMEAAEAKPGFVLKR